MRKFQVENVMCEGCARTIKNALKDEFGEVAVEVASKTISLEVSDDKINELKSELDDIGFPVVSEIK